jgi:hypothetical protein
MDVISTQSLYDSYALKFSIGSGSATRFAAAFLSAYNDCLMDMHNLRIIEEPVLLTTLASNSTLTINYLPIIKVGIINYLQQSGEWVKGDSRDEYAYMNWNRRLGEAANIAVTESEEDGTFTGPWAE